jgi:nitrogen-specific signal transduction histidine kinase
VASERTIQPTLEHARHRDRASTVHRCASFEAHRPSTSAYLAALGASSDGVLLVDCDGVIVYANPAAEAFFGDDALVGQSITNLGGVDRPTLCTIGRELERAQRWRGELSLRTSAPEIEVTVEHLTAQADEPEQLCIVLHGAARRHDKEKEIAETATEHAQSAPPSKLQRFTSEIAHDFNNQIAVILNYTFVLLRHMPADSPLKAHVAEMQAAAWRASQVAQAIHRALSSRTLLPSSK